MWDLETTILKSFFKKHLSFIKWQSLSIKGSFLYVYMKVKRPYQYSTSNVLKDKD